MDTDVCCDCGVSALLKTSKIGNEYYACASVQGLKCKFYQPLTNQQPMQGTKKIMPPLQYSNRSQFQPTRILKREGPLLDATTPFTTIPPSFDFNTVKQPVQKDQNRDLVLELIKERLQKDKELDEKLGKMEQALNLIAEKMDSLAHIFAQQYK